MIYEHTYPHYTECSAVFDQKWHDLVPHPPYSPNLKGWFSFVFLDEHSPQREMFYHYEEVKKKISRCTKELKSISSKTVLSNGNVSIGVLHQMESTLKATEV